MATVGRLDVTPNIPNAIPGRVGLSVDFRDPAESNLDRALVMLDQVVRSAARREGGPSGSIRRTTTLGVRRKRFRKACRCSGSFSPAT